MLIFNTRIFRNHKNGCFSVKLKTGFDYYSYDAGNRLKFLRFHTPTADDENIEYNDFYIDM